MKLECEHGTFSTLKVILTFSVAEVGVAAIYAQVEAQQRGLLCTQEQGRINTVQGHFCPLSPELEFPEFEQHVGRFFFIESANDN